MCIRAALGCLLELLRHSRAGASQALQGRAPTGCTAPPEAKPPRKSCTATNTASCSGGAPTAAGTRSPAPLAADPILTASFSSSDHRERIYVGFPKIGGFGPFGFFFFSSSAVFARRWGPASVSVQRRDGPINLRRGERAERDARQIGKPKERENARKGTSGVPRCEVKALVYFTAFSH